MRLNNSTPSQRAFNLTPLIDVVFLLLVFFMLASTFARFNTIPVETGETAGSALADPSRLVLVKVTAGGRVIVNGLETVPQRLVPELNKLKHAGFARVVITMSIDASVDDLAASLSRVRQSSFKHIQIVHHRP